MKNNSVRSIILLVRLALFTGGVGSAQTAEGREYVVQADDWLSKNTDYTNEES